MVGPEDSWYDTITKVHNSLADIQKLPHENWEITSQDGLSLKAVFYPGTTDKTMIWIHGYTSHAERESAFPGLFYHSLGYNVLVPYLRAHGPSEGKYISFGPMECMDIQKWIDRVNERISGSILIHGLSMGGGIALDLATVELKTSNVSLLMRPATAFLNFSKVLPATIPRGIPKSFQLVSLNGIVVCSLLTQQTMIAARPSGTVSIRCC